MRLWKNPAGPSRKKIPVLALTLLLALGAFAVPARATTLNMVSVGVSSFNNNYAPKLGSPHKDAMGMTKMFQAQKGKMFSQVTVTQLLNEQATSANILNSLRYYRNKANADTYTLLFVASHGGTSNGQYSFCAYDQNVAWSSVQQVLSGLPGKVIVVLDTCGSGGVTFGGNMIVFSACLSSQVSNEDNANGYFTKAFLEGLSGKADINKDGKITLAEMDAYVSDKLEQYNKGKAAKDFQQCTLLRPANVPSSMPLVVLGNTGNNPAPVASLVGTTWQGKESLQGFGKLAFTFQANGQVTMWDVSKSYTGTWSQQGNRVTINLPSVQLTYTGIINGTSIGGQGSDPKNGSWSFNVSRTK